MPDRRKSGSELDTATRVRPLVIGSVFAVFMCAAVTFAVIVVLGNNAALHGPVGAIDKVLAVVGKGVGGPDQWPEDGQNPSYPRIKKLVQFSLDNSQCFFWAIPGSEWGG
ncbi:MAG: hypothetical protein AABM64_08810 [Pseudomonadota bacterium]